MKWTEPERLAYSMQLQDMRREPKANCKTCCHGKHLGWKVYQCMRKQKGNPHKVMSGAICDKWSIN